MSILFNRAIRLSRFKTVELQLSHWPAAKPFDLECWWLRKCDHAGIELAVTTFWRELRIHYYDHRHWDRERGAFEKVPKPVIDRVSSCASCPYVYPQWRGGRFVCAHDDAPGDVDDSSERFLARVIDSLPKSPPSWCPLRRKPTLVVLEIA